METLISKSLEEALGSYKTYLTVILIIYALVSFGIQMYFNHKLTKNVELFKNDLKKVK